MPNEIKINLVLNGKAESLEKVNKAVKDIEASGAKISGSFNSIFSGSSKSASILSTKLSDITIGAGLVGKIASEAGGLIISTFKQAVDEAANFEKSLIGLNSVASNLGQDTSRLNSVILDLTKDGLIPASEAAAALKNLMASGLSLDQSITLFNALKDSAAFNRQGFLSMGEAVVGATQGIKNGNSIMVDNAGITKNLSVLQKEYAASIGTSVGKLSEAQKIQAAYYGILKEAAIFQGDAAKLTKTYSGSVDALDASYKKLLIRIGQFVTQNGVVQRNIQALAETFDRLATPTDDSRSGRIASLTKQIQMLEKSGSSAYGEIAGLKQLLDSLQKEENSVQNSRASLIGNDRTEELLQNGKNRQRIAIIDKKIRDENAAKELEAQFKAKENQEKLYNQLLNKYKDFNTDKVKELENAERRELSIAGNNERLKLAIKENYSKKIVEVQEEEAKKKEKIEKDALDKQLKLEKKRADAIKANRETVNDFFNNVFSDRERGENQTQEDFLRNKGLGQVGGVFKAVLGGAQGASGLVSGAAGFAADAFLPGAGQIVGPLVAELSKGPEHVKKMVQEFAAAVPDLIQATIESIPVLIEELSNQFPVIIERLAEKSDDIILALVKGMPKAALAFQLAMPKAALEFIKGLISGAGDFINALIEKIDPTGGKLSGSLGTGGALGGGKWDATRIGTAVVTGGASEVWNTVSSWTSDLFANGGIMTSKGSMPLNKYSQGGIANRPQLALFGEGRMNEAYVPLPNGRSIPVEMRGGGSSNSNADYLLSQIIRLLNTPQNVTSSLSINGRVFGEILLELNRNNQRLA